VAKLIVGGRPPRTYDSSVLVEWDILIDVDNDPKTGWNWPLICNDISPDYVVRAQTKDGMIIGTYVDIKGNKMGGANCRVNGETIEIIFAPEIVGRPETFTYVIATRKYSQSGTISTLVIADKAPNNGHHNFPGS
jgi:hypothetical protein